MTLCSKSLKTIDNSRKPKDYKSYANIITHYSSEEEKEGTYINANDRELL